MHAPAPEGCLGWLDAGIEGTDAFWLQSTFSRDAQGPSEEEHEAQLRRFAQFKGAEH